MKVYLDMDGVLVDFRLGVCEVFGRDDPSTSWKFWDNWKGVSFKDVDQVCHIGFWEDLWWTPEGELIEQAVLHKFDSKYIYLLTTPMPNTGSGTGKLLWIKKHMPWAYNRTIISYAPKSLLAGPNTLLIDDKDENIEEFVAAGGQGLLVPRPWNKLCGLAGESLQVVKNGLEVF